MMVFSILHTIAQATVKLLEFIDKSEQRRSKIKVGVAMKQNSGPFHSVVIFLTVTSN